MSRFMRQSKYRHVFADKPKKENSYENVKVTGSAWDSNHISAGGKYISVNWNVAGGGAFSILPVLSPFGASSTASKPHPSVPNKLPDLLPLARGHSAPVLDTAWSPFDDNLVASGGEDGKVCVYRVRDEDFEGWGEDKWSPVDWQPDVKISAGGRKVGQVLFHPTASNVLAAGSGDHIVRIFDIEQPSAPKITLDAHDETIQGLAWNQTGTLLATTSRDKKLRIFDPRAGTAPVRKADGHPGVKGSRVVWLGGHDRIATTGFSRSSERQIKVWETGGLTEIKSLTIDQSSGVLMPFYNDANNLLFVAGKGDGNIRYYEFENDNLHFLSEFGAKDPQRGMTFLPRRALDVSENEVARAFKISGTTVEPLAFIVPRKAESFQADIFPPAVSSEPALTADDWFSGKTAQPNFVSLEDGATPVAAPPAPASSFNKSAPTSVAPTPEASISPPAVAAPKSPSTLPPPATEEKAEPSLLEKVKETILPSSAPQTAEPEAKDLEIPAQDEEDSEAEAQQPKKVAAAVAAAKEVGTPVAEPLQAAVTLGAGVNGDSAKDDEIKRLNEELRESRSKIRTLELQVESLRANAHKIAKQLIAGLE